jgi:uncharacterized membrane protein YbaN (DUF454 family)
MNKIKKYILITVGLLFVAIGALGIFIPGLPTTIFMILAAYCFIRSSNRLYNWVITNKLFGAQVKNFIETRSIPLRGKVHSITVMWIMGALSVYLLNAMLWIKILIIVLMIIGTVIILSYPTSKDQ